MIKDGAKTRFACQEDVRSPEFAPFIKILNEIMAKYSLYGHLDDNRKRYPWSLPYLGKPALYAARLWEYPFALMSAELEPGMICADIGCGMTAFTLYLKEIAHCRVLAIDPDIFDSGIKYKCFGVSREFARKTQLSVLQCGMESLALASNSLDRVFCLSVIEHLPLEVIRKGLREMARILKPGGRLIITVDTNLCTELSRPLDLWASLIWDCGLLPLGDMDLRWPCRRFGIYCDGRQPADVFGMTLTKEDYHIERDYAENTEVSIIPISDLPNLRSSYQKNNSPSFWDRVARRIRQAIKLLLRG